MLPIEQFIGGRGVAEALRVKVGRRVSELVAQPEGVFERQLSGHGRTADDTRQHRAGYRRFESFEKRHRTGPVLLLLLTNDCQPVRITTVYSKNRANRQDRYISIA